MPVDGILENYSDIPIQGMRDFIKTSMSSAWSISASQALARTKYPDELAAKKVMKDNVDAAAGVGGVVEIYLVTISGFTERLDRISQLGWEWACPIEIAALRKVEDRPAEQAVPMLNRMGLLMDKLLPNATPDAAGSHRWAGCEGFSRVVPTRMVTVFDGVEDFWNDGWAVGLIEVAPIFQVEGM